MNRHHRKIRYPLILVILLVQALLAGTLLSCVEKSAKPVSYTTQIKPILDQYCIECHVPGGTGFEKSGLNLETYDDLLKGTRLGPVIIPGNAVSSTLVLLVEGKSDPAIKMPHGTNKTLTKENISILKNWIDQGAKNN